MFRSLVFQVLWAPALALGLAGAGIALQTRAIAEERALRAPLESERSAVIGPARLLANRHGRTTERVRAAILETDPESQLAILNYTAGHYLRRMRSLTDSLRNRLDALSPLEQSARLDDRVARIGELLDTLDGEATLVANSIDRLRSAVEGADLGQFDDARVEFETSVARVAEDLATLDGAARRLMRIRGEMRLSPKPRVPAWTWLVLGVAAAVAMLIAGYRLRRLERASGDSDVERAIQRRHREDAKRISDLENELAAQGRNREIAEGALRRGEQDLALMRIYSENLINSLRSAVVVTDLASTVTGFNRAAKELIGPQLRENLREHPIGSTLNVGVGDFASALERALEDGRPLRATALPYLENRLIDVAIVAYLDERGSARGLLWVVDDVTENVETKNRLLAAERLAAVGRLSAQVAHEIRNPLSAIGLNAELLEDELANEAEARALLRAIAGEIERLTEVTEGYLQLTRNPEPHATLTDVNGSIRDLLSMLGPELRSHDIEVRVELDDGSAHAWVDPGQLRQAMLNVLRNAREAMPDGGAITIHTGRSGNFTFVDVVDEGPGIPELDRARVFEPFFTTKPDGTGLGLSLTQQILREHHGDVELQGAAGGGTRIRLLLPLKATDRSAEIQ
ncbi:MAG: ATP-binding protein [Myxococcota bacterium]